MIYTDFICHVEHYIRKRRKCTVYKRTHIYKKNTVKHCVKLIFKKHPLKNSLIPIFMVTCVKATTRLHFYSFELVAILEIQAAT